MTITVRHRNMYGYDVEVDLTGFRVDPFELMAKLDTLGSADAIALFLHGERICGDAGEADRCPLAVYLERETGVRPSVGLRGWVPRHPYATDLPEPYRSATDLFFALPPHVKAFVAAVDGDAYPELLIGNEIHLDGGTVEYCLDGQYSFGGEW